MSRDQTLGTAYSKRRTITGGLDIGKGFQLIVGTSTGAIIGCALAAGTAPARVMQLYRQHGAEVFPKKLPSKFTITKLIEESFVADEHREDVALRETMRRMHDRLKLSLEVSHPTTAGERLTTADDPKAAFLRDKLSNALEDLKVLDDPACTAKQARKAWDKVFNTDFFADREAKEAAAASGVTVLSKLLSERGNPRPIDKQGGGRFA